MLGSVIISLGLGWLLPVLFFPVWLIDETVMFRSFCIESGETHAWSRKMNTKMLVFVYLLNML